LNISNQIHFQKVIFVLNLSQVEVDIFKLKVKLKWTFIICLWQLYCSFYFGSISTNNS